MRQITTITLILVVVGAFWLSAGGAASASKKSLSPGEISLYSVEKGGFMHTEKVVHSEDEWKLLLSEEQYNILREQGTERAFTGKYWDNKEHGVYRCAGCGLDLYLSDAKYKSGTGWPSYYQAVNDKNVSTRSDNSFFMSRNELVCSRCGGHLGHIFDDGPAPTGKRHCINSGALIFHKLDN